MDERTLHALANPIRIRILKSLRQGSKTYSDIMRVLELDLERDRGKFTYHLNLLREAKVIEEEGGLYHLTNLGGRALAASEMPESNREGIPPGAKSDIDTARGLTLAAMLVVGVLGFLVLSFMSIFFVPVRSFFLAILVGAAIAALFPLLIYFLVYRPLKEERVEDALTPALALGILTLIFAGIIPGIILLVAYVKAKDAQSKIQQRRNL